MSETIRDVLSHIAALRQEVRDIEIKQIEGAAVTRGRLDLFDAKLASLQERIDRAAKAADAALETSGSFEVEQLAKENDRQYEQNKHWFRYVVTVIVGLCSGILAAIATKLLIK